MTPTEAYRQWCQTVPPNQVISTLDAFIAGYEAAERPVREQDYPATPQSRQAVLNDFYQAKTTTSVSSGDCKAI